MRPAPFSEAARARAGAEGRAGILATEKPQGHVRPLKASKAAVGEEGHAADSPASWSCTRQQDFLYGVPVPPPPLGPSLLILPAGEEGRCTQYLSPR